MDDDWKINSGQYGKWLQRQLPEGIWNRYEQTFTGKDYEELWDALAVSGGLVREIGQSLAEKLGYKYPMTEDRNVMESLRKLKSLGANRHKETAG